MSDTGKTAEPTALPKAAALVCVSGLHHLVELEKVAAAIASNLAPGGEFWSIGEQVGRNGSRLWPDAYEVKSCG